MDELRSFLEGVQSEDEDLSLDELELVAGGTHSETMTCYLD